MNYDKQNVLFCWREDDGFPYSGRERDKFRFLLRYAILAPSFRNSQPWKFDLTDEAVTITADYRQWQAVADADRRELNISVGCAVENLLVAAKHFEYDTHVEFAAEEDSPTITVHMEATKGPLDLGDDFLFEAIPLRHTRHDAYESRSVLPEELDALRLYGAVEGVNLNLTGDPYVRSKVDRLIVQANAVQFAAPDFRRELTDSLEKGVYDVPWLLHIIGEMAAGYLDREDPGRVGHEPLMGAPVLGLLSSEADGWIPQVRTGQSLERLWLTATAFGIQVHPISQIVQVSETRDELARLLARADQFPQLPFRLGYTASTGTRPARRPLEDFLVRREPILPRGELVFVSDQRRCA